METMDVKMKKVKLILDDFFEFSNLLNLVWVLVILFLYLMLYTFYACTFVPLILKVTTKENYFPRAC